MVQQSTNFCIFNSLLVYSRQKYVYPVISVIIQWLSIYHLTIRARGKQRSRSFSPGASRAPQESDQSFHWILWGISLFFEIGRLPLHFSEIGHQFLHDFLRSVFTFYLSAVIWHLFHRFWDRTSPHPEIGHWIEVRSQNEEMSYLKNGQKSRGKKGSLKSRREKIVWVYINMWGLWSDPYGAQRLRG